MNHKTILTRIFGLCLAGLIAALAGCGGRSSLGGIIGGALPGLDDLGPGSDKAALDSDRDGVPDTIEAQLGTSPSLIDTDGDGLTDHYELWGDKKLPLGQVGDLASLPDPDGNGVIAPLDPSDMGPTEILKNASALLKRLRVAVEQPDGSFSLADLDGDGIPNDFELNGYYFQVAEDGVPYFYRWDGLDITKKYFKTDPTQWSSDGDPFSDWEEATKINLDQRVKTPGDHPCIPAYPQLILAMNSYTVDLNQDVEVTSTAGGSTESSWTNATETVSNGTTIYNETGGEGELKLGFTFTREATRVVGGNTIEIPDFSVGFTAEGSGYTTSVDKITNSQSSITTQDNSGMTAQEWQTATLVSGSTADAARLTLNLRVINIGTLPATNPIILCNLRLGGVAINSLIVNLGEYGEFQARAANYTDLIIQFDGRASDFAPQGDPLSLSLYQLRSIEAGVPLELEVTGFTADTLVWALDPSTGRRSYLTMGEWTPYQSAIQNVTAKLLLDFRDQGSTGGVNVNGMPRQSTMETRVFCYRPDVNYVGSPPEILLGEAFLWAFGGAETDLGPAISIRDPVTNRNYSAPLALWEFSFDKRTVEQILAEPERFANVFSLPLEPSNPGERVYTASAPPPEALQNPKIYWATCDPATRKVRAFSRDVRGIKEMRFKPDPAADYLGEKMVVGYNPEDSHQQFSYTYELPAGYHWTGNEQVVAINRADKETKLSAEIDGGALGFLTHAADTGVVWTNKAATYTQGFNFMNGISTDPLADFTLTQKFVGTTLNVTVTPNYGTLHDAWFVLDGTDASGNPVYVIDYNYLRKQAFDTSVLSSTVASTLTLGAPLAHTYGVRSQNGVLAVVTPQLATNDVVAPYRWYINKLAWRTYEGI